MKRLLISLMLLCTFIPTQTLFAQSFTCNEFVCECSSSESSITPTDSDQFAFTANVIAAGDTLDIAGSLCNDLCFDLTRTTPGAASYEVQCLDNGIETLAAGSVTDPDTYIPLGEEVSEIPKPEAQVPNLAVPIPGLTFSQNFIGEYVNAIYQLLLVFASVISIIMIMVAGLQWMMARGDAGKVGQAKERIGKAILSIVVILLVAAITTLIDPRLTNFNALTIKSIDAIPLSSTLGEEGAPGGGDAASCAEAEANAKKSGTCSI